MVYGEVVQAVLLFGSESLVLYMAMGITVQGTHNGFLIQITWKWVWRRADRMWSTTAVEEVRTVTVTQLAKT